MQKQLKQSSVFGVPLEKSETLNVYHDESGTDIDHERFQLHGALMVPVSKFQNALQLLQQARDGYDGQIHFVDLRDKGRSPKARVAAQWLSLFFTEISSYCFYKCMIVDMKSPTFDQARLSKPHILYNHTALQALYSGIVWCFKSYDQVTLSIYSEAITRAKNDNFETYIPNELIKRARNNPKCPDINVPSMMVMPVNGNPREVESNLAEHCEFIQLTDLLTGSVSQAINAKASQQVKIDMGKLVAGWISDTRLPPWLQRNQLHRRFSISCYPDGKGDFYAVPLVISSQSQAQMSFDGILKATSTPKAK